MQDKLEEAQHNDEDDNTTGGGDDKIGLWLCVAIEFGELGVGPCSDPYR